MNEPVRILLKKGATAGLSSSASPSPITCVALLGKPAVAPPNCTLSAGNDRR